MRPFIRVVKKRKGGQCTLVACFPFASVSMSSFPNQDVEPFDTGPLFWWVLALLGLALLLEFYVAVPWTEPLTEPSTWVLFGVLLGVALRLTGEQYPEETTAARGLRWASFVAWCVSAVVGLLVWLG